ncbi:putative YkuD domain protein [Vibrio nigripulchritudo SFn27]|nr:putative YkuD domain protein [Vibrio nigripulchritudo AM115]CCN44180.1 putative YkuD domain protein [Vibrio nigripulchritudo FTn2]CCN66992.1 putative YkuD domain protein [Vibrio nigripulchritudo POn4]CCN74136.1 putative YkuD domain protein [Vibrio nigripulchritudo SO65]CCN81029.1 putative YkuD domain protein [Vibrio nigripulchritudo BLFn1]CCN86920.1 putative YkuD domain protein [Vibrio nigripulchritudo SFn27]CCN95213.1 putative YkuD domain protein [Vibrio nigripulchritudo ENn2]CCO38304.1 
MVTTDKTFIKMIKKTLTLCLSIITLFLPTLACSSVDLVKVVKAERKMYLIDEGKIIKEYRIALGGSPKGHKVQEGDHKTPEGRYILDYKKEDSAFHRAMHISYPNTADKAKAKELGVDPGGFIMVHGNNPKNKYLQVDWTEGCIAITDDEMDEFMDLVQVGTPIEIMWTESDQQN